MCTFILWRSFISENYIFFFAILVHRIALGSFRKRKIDTMLNTIQGCSRQACYNILVTPVLLSLSFAIILSVWKMILSRSRSNLQFLSHNKYNSFLCDDEQDENDVHVSYGNMLLLFPLEKYLVYHIIIIRVIALAYALS